MCRPGLDTNFSTPAGDDEEEGTSSELMAGVSDGAAGGTRLWGPHAAEAELRDAGGDALLGGALALAGQLAARWLVDVVVGDATLDGRLGGVEVRGELGDAPALVDEGLQAAAQVGEAVLSGLLVEVALLATVDSEAALNDQAGRRWCW